MLIWQLLNEIAKEYQIFKAKISIFFDYKEILYKI